MLIEPYIKKNYPITQPYVGINSIEEELMKHQFFIVMGHHNNYLGMLTIPDVCTRKKKLVTDCLLPKPHISPHSTIEQAMFLMISSHLPAIPVIDDDKTFLGVLIQDKLIETIKQLQEERNQMHAHEVSVSERIKEEFVKSISHEIRTPLNAIQGLSEILIYSEISSEDKENFAGLLHAKTDELLGVVDSLLNLSRIEAGDYSISTTENVQLSYVFKILMDKALQIRASYKKDHLSISPSIKLPDNYNLQTNLSHLQQVAIHLINNAIKFTKEGEVEFGCFLDEKETLVFYVKDTGIGIQPHKQETIFRAFEKGWSPDTHIYPGLGLGLTIASKIIESEKGHIWFKSEPDKGTCFYFHL